MNNVVRLRRVERQPRRRVSDRPTVEPSEGLLFRLMRCAYAQEEKVEALLGAAGLSIAKYSVLMHLATAGSPLALSEVAARSRCVRSNITQLIDRLESEGLVERVSDPRDRRIIRARLTAAGDERRAAGAKILDAAQANFASSIRARDRALLARLLTRLNQL
jgi:DNA-binding MarR family transcriptional regulator